MIQSSATELCSQKRQRPRQFLLQIEELKVSSALTGVCNRFLSQPPRFPSYGDEACPKKKLPTVPYSVLTHNELEDLFNESRQRKEVNFVDKPRSL